MPLGPGWKEFAARLKAMPDAVEKRLKLATLQSAVGLVSKIKEGILEQAPGGKRFLPLHPFTLAQRTKGSGSGEPKRLINNGDLLGAIVYEIIDDGWGARVGVNRKAINRDGDALVDIARVQEEGRVIAVTPKMRAYLHANGLHLKESTTHIIIPPSPFLEPSYRAYRDEIRERYRKAFVGAVREGG